MITALKRAAIGLAALATLHGPASAAETELEIGYMPILPVSQLFVALEEGWLKSAGIKPKLVQFQNGPAMVQALLAGQLDVAHFGIGPAMVARAKNADIKVVAASIVEQISFIALPQLAPYLESGDPATAFARFRKDKGRKAVVTTFPVGSVPETVLQHWLRKILKADLDDVQIIYQGAAQVQQALLTGAVDGAAILEPVVTNILEKVKDAKVVARGSQLFAGQPGAVLAVRERLLRDKPDVVKALVAAHARATDMLNKEPERAAKAVQKYVGGGRMDLKTVESALRNSAGTFRADPSAIIKGTTEMRDFQEELGTLKVKVKIDDLFDTGPYKAVTQ
jgi:NitT/TauT family transport system substrate-binding protein